MGNFMVHEVRGQKWCRFVVLTHGVSGDNLIEMDHQILSKDVMKL